MPDPVWTAAYNYGQTPEQNGFTRQLYGTPSILQQTSGSPANRRVEINSDNGDAIFLSSGVPALSSVLGATAEAVVRVSGAGQAGFELTFLDRAVLVQIFQSRIELTLCQNAPPHQVDVPIPTAANTSNITVRLTYDGTNIKVWRNGVLIDGPRPLLQCTKPFQRVLWWGEAGGVQVFQSMRYYIAGAVEPG